MSQNSVRLAREQDAAEIARLATQLGYPVTGDTMQPRLQRLLANPNDVVFVAESQEGGLAGWCHGFLSQLLESNYRVEIGGLVVDERFQRQGIGRKLVRRVESWAIERGVVESSVRCRTTRTEAHQFYERSGYQPTKTQIVFRKALS